MAGGDTARETGTRHEPCSEGCRHVTCGRCGQHTDNGSQGRYWAVCKVDVHEARFHFCCPDNCELHPVAEAKVIPQQPAAEPVLTDRQAMLLAAISRCGGDWTPLRARAVLAEGGYPQITKGRAHQIMKQLAEHGYLEPIRPRAYTYRLVTPRPAAQNSEAPQ